MTDTESQERQGLQECWAATVLTLYPEMFPGSLGQSLAGRALKTGLWSLETVDIRDFARDKHRSVDDTPSGGGAGMVMRPDVVDAALASVEDRPGPLLYLSPRGRLLDQEMVRDLAAGPGATLLCGRYEGVDQRVLDAREIVEVSVGDYVLSGGEPAALVLMDAVVRLLPGVMGNDDSSREESFEEGLLEYPLYTRPSEWQGREVPEVLTSGHHDNIRLWRLAQAEEITKARRPDLWGAVPEAKKRRARYAPRRRRVRKRAMNTIQQLEQEQVAALSAKGTAPDFAPGDTVRVNVKVIEGTRERIQAFEGVCIARKNRGLQSSFTVRKISYGGRRRACVPALQPAPGFGRAGAPR